LILKPKALVTVLVLTAFGSLEPYSSHAAMSDIELPDIGDPTGTLMTPQQEMELGAAFYRNLHSQMEINSDPEISDYIQSLGSKLTTNSDTPSQPFTFFVVNQPVINAFAGPGGFIGVNSGLILLSEEESELASVLAHEISHVTQRHLFQTFQAASRMAIPSALAMLGAALIGAAGGGGNAAMAAMMAARGMSQQYQINFTRDNEVEADRVGMQIMSKSEFNPRSMPAFFERMQQSTRFAGNRIPEFLLTHPVTVARISDTRDRSEHFAYKQYPDSMAYQIIRAKLRVTTAPSPRNALDYFNSMHNRGTGQQQDVIAYGMALAQSKLGQTEKAKTTFQRLVQTYPHQSQFMNALAGTEMDAKNFSKAAQLYELALQRFPDNQAMTLNYVRALLNIQQAAEARQLLHGFLKHHPATPDVYELMAETYSKLGMEGESHRYYAEGYYLLGQTKSALLQLQLAKRTAGNNFYLNSVIDERMQRWRDEEQSRKE
jgi:predicted Zn-dependent protease